MDYPSPQEAKSLWLRGELLSIRENDIVGVRLRMKTYTANLEEQRRKKWHIVDADGQILGRLATRIATILRGKHSPMYSPHLDLGDHVVVINAEKVKLTGRKLDQKTYWRHSGYPGGLKITPIRRVLGAHPDRVITHAVKGMLPKNNLGRKMMKKLRVYAGPNHEHVAQKPEPLKL